MLSRFHIPMLPDKYLAMLCWVVLLLIYLVLIFRGMDVKFIEGMLSTAFGALMMGLQVGFKRLENAPYRSTSSVTTPEGAKIEQTETAQ